MMTDTRLLADIVDLERQFWESFGSSDFCRIHLADDAIVSGEMGVLGKEAVLDVMASAQPWERHTISDAQMIDIADGVIGLTYRASALRNGGNHRIDVTVSSVYALRTDGWTLVMHQETPDA